MKGITGILPRRREAAVWQEERVISSQRISQSGCINSIIVHALKWLNKALGSRIKVSQVSHSLSDCILLIGHHHLNLYTTKCRSIPCTPGRSTINIVRINISHKRLYHTLLR